MIQKILLPMILFKIKSSQRQLQKIADVMSFNSMKEIDTNIIGEIFEIKQFLTVNYMMIDGLK
jgi:hypothetical protein